MREDNRKTEQQTSQQKVSKGQTGQQPAATEQAPDFGPGLATLVKDLGDSQRMQLDILREAFEAFRIQQLELKQTFAACQGQWQIQVPKPFEGNAMNAVNVFNDIVAGLQLKFAPDQPASFSARVVGPNQIDLSWSEATNNPDGFKLERREGTAGTFSEIKQLGATARTYSDTGLKSGTSYTYRLRAFNFRGDSPPGEISATTP